VAKRAALRWLAQQHPEWTHQDLADALGMSHSWVSKWLRRLRQADPADVMALHSRSRARYTPPASIASQPAVVQRILEIRLEPPENLQRAPGPEAILYYIHRDPVLQRARVRLPRSQTTIWKILRQAGCIAQVHRRKPKPFELREPGEEVQFDLKDGSQVPADPEGKRQHVVEIANFVDAGTSIWLHREVRSDFDAEALFEVVAQFFCQYGLPAMLTFDNDPRLVGSPSGRDFPSALVRFLLCLGVIPNVIPPRRPDLNAYVERFHRSLGQECLQVHRPGTLAQVAELTEAFLSHYNSERPNQARSCGNQPPRVACQQFPTLPAAPEMVDPDRWLGPMHKHAFARSIRAGGT
jgi:transcriptional regulator with XRE-family HTH domain